MLFLSSALYKKNPFQILEDIRRDRFIAEILTPQFVFTSLCEQDIKNIDECDMCQRLLYQKQHNIHINIIQIRNEQLPSKRVYKKGCFKTRSPFPGHNKIIDWYNERVLYEDFETRIEKLHWFKKGEAEAWSDDDLRWVDFATRKEKAANIGYVIMRSIMKTPVYDLYPDTDRGHRDIKSEWVFEKIIRREEKVNKKI